jgi:DeoR/GlpR family transcriptional regulator of sugar metabolism
MNLLPEERAETILRRLQRDGRVLVDTLAGELSVSGETIRRDLKRLERSGLLRRSHGGAVPMPPSQEEDLSFPARSILNISAKRRIAAAAAAHVADGQALMMDSSSTVQEALRALGDRRDLTIVTNSIGLLTDPASRTHRVISVGGEYEPDIMTFHGPLAVAAARQFHADLTIISVKALSRRSGLMVANAAEAEIKRAFIECADQTLLLVDGDKFDSSGLVAVGPLSSVDILITDREPDEEWSEIIAGANVRLEMAG